jgi:hypothetical protein
MTKLSEIDENINKNHMWLKHELWEMCHRMKDDEILNRIDLLENLIKEQAKVGKWIPVSERLPEENKNSEYYDSVIVTLDSGRVVSGCYVNCYEEWWVDAEDGEKCSINATGRVVAWMPLPKAYKEEVTE